MKRPLWTLHSQLYKGRIPFQVITSHFSSLSSVPWMLLSILVVQCVDKVITIYVGQVPKAEVDACCLGMGFDWYSGSTAPDPKIAKHQEPYTSHILYYLTPQLSVQSLRLARH
jgi:hypothetical protein